MTISTFPWCALFTLSQILNEGTKLHRRDRERKQHHCSDVSLSRNAIFFIIFFYHIELWVMCIVKYFTYQAYYCIYLYDPYRNTFSFNGKCWIRCVYSNVSNLSLSNICITVYVTNLGIAPFDCVSPKAPSLSKFILPATYLENSQLSYSQRIWWYFFQEVVIY